MEFKIRFSGRAHDYTKEEVSVVVVAMENADPLTQGKHRDAFEKRFREYAGVKHAFAVCNATAALEMAAQLCLFQPGDEIIAPSHTFTASVYPFLKKGAKVVWADIDPKTRVMGPDEFRSKITPRTKAVIAVHLYGYTANMPAIMEIAREHNIIVIEDAAQSLGTELEGRKSGSFGDFGVYSFHSHKNVTTLGEGGMLAVADDEAAAVVPMLRHNGHCGFDGPRQDYWIPAMGNVDMPVYRGVQLWPNNYCLGEVECALGSLLLDRIDSINKEKRDRALKFIDALNKYSQIEFLRVDNERHSYHLLAAHILNGKRDEFIRRMAVNKGIQCVVQYYPLNRYDLYKKTGNATADCPNADLFFDNMVSFPFHHRLREEELEYIAVSAGEVLEELG